MIAVLIVGILTTQLPSSVAESRQVQGETRKTEDGLGQVSTQDDKQRSQLPAEDEEAPNLSLSPDDSQKSATAFRCDCAVPMDALTHFPEGRFWSQSNPEAERSTNLKAALRKQAIGSAVVVMMVNDGEIDLLENLLCSMRLNGVNKYLVFALTTSAYTKLRNAGIKVFNVKTIPGIGEKMEEFNGPQTFKSSGFKVVSRLKVTVFQAVVSLKFSLFFQDVDVIWTENVIPEVLKVATPMTFMKDADEFSRVRRLAKREEYNTGFFVLRAGGKQQAFMREVVDTENTHHLHDDQKMVNAIAKGGKYKGHIGFFPREEYVNGCFLNSFSKGLVPSKAKTNLTEEDKKAVLQRVKVAHVNCCTTKMHKLVMLCTNGMWYCKNPSLYSLDKGAADKVKRACATPS
eukprot:gene15044-17778_t